MSFQHRFDERGFTLIELLVATTISLILFGAVAGAFIATVENYTSSASRLTQSSDAQSITTWLTADIESAGPASANVNQSPTDNPCAVTNTGANLVTFTWSDATSPTVTDVAAYWLAGSTLSHYSCAVSASGSPGTVSQRFIGRSVLASSTSVTVTGAKVTVAIGEPNSSFTVSATRRVGVYLSSFAPTTDITGSTLAAASLSFNLAGDSCLSPSCGTLTASVFGPQPSAPSGCSSGGTVIGSSIAVNGSGNYSPSSGFTPGAPGDYWWYVTYSGDADTGNASISTPCPASETTVQNTSALSSLAATETIASGASATIQATLVTTPTAPAPTGTITYYISGPSPTAPATCTGSAWTIAGTSSVSGDSTYSTSMALTGTGDYWWYVTYSGDTSNLPTQTLCPPGAETTVATTAPSFSITTNQSFSTLPGSVLGLAINNFAPSESVTIHLDSASGTTLVSSPATITTDASGFATGFTVSLPTGLVGGDHKLEAVGSSGDTGQSNAFHINPSTAITGGQFFSALPATLGGGLGIDFGSSETLTLHLDSASGTTLVSSPATLLTNSSGATRAFTVTLPSTVAQGTHTIVALGSTSGLSATSNTFAVVPIPSSVVTANGGSTPGKLEPNDTITVAFSGQLRASSICSAWTDGITGTQSDSTGSVITVTNTGGDNILSFTTPPSSCGAFNFGQIDLGNSGYVTSTGTTNFPATFANSTITYDGGAHTITITLGSVGGGGTENVVSNSTLTLTLSTNIVDLYGNPLGFYQLSSASGTQF